MRVRPFRISVVAAMCLAVAFATLIKVATGVAHTDGHAEHVRNSVAKLRSEGRMVPPEEVEKIAESYVRPPESFSGQQDRFLPEAFRQGSPLSAFAIFMIAVLTRASKWELLAFAATYSMALVAISPVLDFNLGLMALGLLLAHVVLLLRARLARPEAVVP